MNVSLKRVKAIFMKDYKEFSRNYSISIMLFLPIVFALFYRSDNAEQVFIFGFLINISLAMLTSFMQACLIAEEREKNTLRSIMMTPASILDILLGKSILVFISTALVMVVTIYIFGYMPSNTIVVVFALCMSIILYTAVGTICGLYSKTVLEASLTIFPVLIIFTAAPFATLIEDKYPILKVLQYLPSSQLSELFLAIETGLNNSELIGSVVIITVWTVVITFVSFVLYKKRLTDE